MPIHKFSKNMYLEEIVPEVQQLIMSQTDFSLFVNMINTTDIDIIVFLIVTINR